MNKFRLYSIKTIERACRRSYSEANWSKPNGFDTKIQIYNCIKKEKVPLILRNDYPFATWYTCGPTVYDSSHIGHASCYMKVDIIQRIMKTYFGIDLISAMNITDIDDKIIRKAEELGKPWKEISNKYEEEFWNDLNKLNILPPDIKIRVCDNIPKIVAFINDLVDRKFAYVGNDNSVYFKVDSYPNYGKLQKVGVPEQIASDANKHSAADFALWKSKKSSNEPSWDSPWGEGRPGWHIECSALASHIFGSQIDVHAGGMDLRFPHHENEDAQSCAFHGCDQWINYWMHIGQLSIRGDTDKMSKSLKNTISVDQMLSEYSAEVFRMACICSNYRNTMEYSVEMMETAKHTLSKYKTFMDDCRSYLNGSKGNIQLSNSTEILDKFRITKNLIDQHLKDDFNTAQSISVLSGLISNVSKNWNHSGNNLLYTSKQTDVIGPIFKHIENLFHIFGFNERADATESIETNLIIEDIVELRQRIRQQAVGSKNKDLFKVCDNIRDTLRERGIVIKDHTNLSSWSKNKL